MNDQPARSQVRITVIGLVVASLFATLLGRLAWLQLIDPDLARTGPTSVGDLRTVPVAALRGTILDSAGEPLATSRAALVVTVDPMVLADQPDGGAEVLERLARTLGESVTEIEARATTCGAAGAAPSPTCYDGPTVQPAPVAEDVDPLVAVQIMEDPAGFPGVDVEGQAIRTYPAPHGANAAHVLGYLTPVTADDLANGGADGLLVATDLVGRAGLEQEYDADLRGTAGSRTVVVDPRGAVVAEYGAVASIPGHDVRTSIDASIQAVTERALGDAMAAARTRLDPDGVPYRADGGAAVVLDVTDGSVLALASAPTYDPADWVGGISTDAYAALTDEAAGLPLLSRPVQGELAPASTFKPVTTAAALEAGYSRGPYDCSSALTVGNRSFANYESRAYGPISLARALEVSCDTVFYRLGYDLWLRDGGTSPVADPADAVTEMARGWGLGRPTGIDLPAEADGRVADRAWKQSAWEATRVQSCARAVGGYPEVAEDDPARAAYLTALARENCEDGWRLRAGDAVNTAIGQGDTLVTPVQMAVAYAAVANGGTLWTPRIGEAIVDRDGSVMRELGPTEAGRLPVSAGTLGYVRTALQGVTRSGTGAAAFAGFPLDRIPVGSKTGSGEVFGAQSTAWFVAFSDRYVVAVAITQGGTGGATSGPAVRKIFDALYAAGRVAP